MTNTKELKKKMIDKTCGVSDIARVIDKSYSTAHKKVNGKTNFTLSEAEKIQAYLEIEDRDFCKYFLGHTECEC